jgi:uncharacterized RDD family membrane protein YckC
MSDDWFFEYSGQQQGPVRLHVLRQMAASGQLRPDALVWRAGMAQWTPAGQVGEVGPFPAAGAMPGAGAGAGAMPYGGAQPVPLGYYTPAEVLEYGGFWRRVLAYILDALIVGVPLFLLFAGLDVMVDVDPFDEWPSSSIGQTLEVIDQVVNFLAAWLYFALLESGAWQATLGKRVLGMRVTDMAGQRIGFGRATGRYFGKIVSAIILLIGFIMVAFTQRKQGLHDIMAGTVVPRTGG